MTAFLISKPSTPAITGLSIQSGVKSTVLSWDALQESLGATYEVWASSTNNLSSATLVAQATTSTYTVTGLTDTTYFWVRGVNKFGVAGTYSSGVQYTPSLITSNDVGGIVPVSAGLGVGSSSGAGSLPTYGTWHAYVAGSFTPTDDSVISISMYLASAISNVNVPFGNEVKVWARTRLRDTTTNQDVPSGTKQYLLYNSMGMVYGSLNNLNNFHETFVTGFRGLLIPGHNYTLYGELMKERTGAATCDVQANMGGVATSGSATF